MTKKVPVGVGVFVVRKDETFLMGQRQGAHGEGTWSVPGGWIEYGESWEEAAIREIKEETGLDISSPVEFVTATNNIMRKDDVHSVTIWLKTPYRSGEPQILEPDKFIKQDWFTLSSLPQPLFKPWEDLLSQDIDMSIKSR